MLGSPLRNIVSAIPTLSLNVETPDALNCVVNNVSVDVVIPAKVETPDTFNWLVSIVASTKTLLLNVEIPVNVEAPLTFTSSNSVCPPTSNAVKSPNEVIFGCSWEAEAIVPVNIPALTPSPSK